VVCAVVRSVLGVAVVSALSSVAPVRASEHGGDCMSATTIVARARCADPGLVAQGDEVEAAFDRARRELSPASQRLLVEDQTNWRAFVERACGSPEDLLEARICLSRKYRARSASLTATGVRMGPYLFARASRFRVLPGEGAPFVSQVAYPLVDEPQSEAAKAWNGLVALNTSALDGVECDGRQGDVVMDVEVVFAKQNVIGVSSSRDVYCHGTPHSQGGSKERTYVLGTTVHALTAEEMFKREGWVPLLSRACRAALGELGDSSASTVGDGLVRLLVTDVGHWRLAKDGLVIVVGAGELLPRTYGGRTVTVPWDDLKPFLAPGAPFFE